MVKGNLEFGILDIVIYLEFGAWDLEFYNMVYLIPLVIIIVSFLIIVFIVVKKLPHLVAINVESITQEKETKIKNKILIERLARNFSNFKKFLTKIFKPVLKNISLTSSRIYQKTVELEKESLSRQPSKKINLKQKIAEKIKIAKKFLIDQEFNKAEEICISILELDKNNLDAYEILVEIYREEKEYKKARETCRYLIKILAKSKVKEEENGIKHRLANGYADLGLVYQLENKLNYALANFQKAVELEPSNPRFLDLLLKICIILKNKKLALQTFRALKKADPGNQKLSELKKEIGNLPS